MLKWRIVAKASEIIFAGSVFCPAGKTRLKGAHNPNAYLPTVTLLVCMMAMTTASAPTLAGPFGQSAYAMRDSTGTIQDVAPDWRVVCLDGSDDVFGAITSHRHCRLEKDNFHAIAIMTSRGLTIPLRAARTPCSSVSGNLSVDNQAIHKMPLRKQLVALANGHTLARTYQTPWPECAKLNEYTGLGGFSAALARLKMQWAKFH